MLGILGSLGPYRVPLYIQRRSTLLIKTSKSKGREAQPAAGKQALLLALHFYTSKKLDEIAEEEFLKWIKTQIKRR